MDIRKYLKQLFSAVEQSSVSNPVHHEILKRTDQYLSEYESWKNSANRKQITDWLIAEFSVSESNPQSLDEAIDFMDNPHARGFIIYYKSEYFESDFEFLMDYLQEKILQLGYRNYMSDIKSFTKNENVETVQRHYLKPKPGFEPPINQEFGNITIELVFKNEKTKLLRLSASHYSDRLYTKPKEFSKLIYSLR